MTPIYTASPWQNRFHALRVNEALGAGSVGPGKTETLIHDPVPRIWREHLRCEGKLPQFPLKWGRSVGWALHLRRTFPMLEQTITRSKRVYPEIDPGAHWDTQRHTWTFSSGYKLQFGHCQNNDDWMQYQSGEYDWIGFDELTQFEREQYNQINARLRSSDPLLMHECYTRAMSNPSTRRDGNFNLQLKDPTWVRKRFVDPCRDGNKVIKHKLVRGDGTVEYKTRIYLPASLYDNPNKAFVRQYELQLLDLPPHLLQAYLHGNWYAQVGGFYSDAWDENEHVCRPFQIPDHWKRFRSLDWGYKQPGCCLWWAMDDEGTLYCEREYTFQGQEVPQVAKRIMEIEKDLGLWHRGRSLITGPADTQLWEKRGDAVRTKAAEFAAAGIPWVQADKSPGSRSRAAQLFMGRLKAHQNHTTRAGVIFFETCVMCRNTIPGIMSDKDDWETPLDGGEDHWHDACVRPDQLVSTERGPVQLKDVTSADRVLSTDGAYHACSGYFKTREAAPTMRVLFDNGLSLVATPDHRVLCADGAWRRVDQLDATMYAFSPWTPQSSAQPAKSSTESATTGPAAATATTEPRQGVGAAYATYTATFGDSTAETFRPSTTYITGPVDMTTIASETLRPSRSANIVQSTGAQLDLSGARSTSARRSPPRRHGTEARRVALGTDSTPQTPRPRESLPATLFAKYAVVPLSTAAQALTRSCAPTPAAPSIGATPESMTSNAYALSAGQHSWSAGSRVPAPAHGSAVKIVAVEHAPPSDVGCLNVPGMGAFVAEGVVVSNCMYATSFASHGKKGLPTVKRYEREEGDDDDEPRRPKPVNLYKRAYGPGAN